MTPRKKKIPGGFQPSSWSEAGAADSVSPCKSKTFQTGSSLKVTYSTPQITLAMICSNTVSRLSINSPEMRKVQIWLLMVLLPSKFDLNHLIFDIRRKQHLAGDCRVPAPPHQNCGGSIEASLFLLVFHGMCRFFLVFSLRTRLCHWKNFEIGEPQQLEKLRNATATRSTLSRCGENSWSRVKRSRRPTTPPPSFLR